MGKADEMPDGEAEERNSRRANTIDIHVGSRVRLRRMVLGMSQERLGEQLGLTFQQVQKYEKGVNRIGAGRLFDLANVLNVPIQFFYDDAPSQHAASGMSAAVDGFAESSGETDVIDFLSTREGLELNRAFVRISDSRVRRSVLELVRSLAVED